MVMEKNAVLIHATTQMSLESIMLSQRRQIQKASYFVIPFIRNVQSKCCFPGTGRKKGWGVIANEYIGFLLRVIKCFDIIESGDGNTAL